MRHMKNLNLKKYREIYLMLFLTFLLVTRVVPIAHFMNNQINFMFGIVFSFFGIVYTLLSIFKYGFKRFMHVDYILLLVFLLISFCSTILNLKYGYLDNVKMLIWMYIQYFTLYILIDVNDKEVILKEIVKIFIIPVIITTVSALISIIQFILKIEYQTTMPDYPRWQGFHDARLFGVFDDPNYASIACIIAVFILGLLIYTSKNTKLKKIYSVTILVNVIYVVLSGSRTGELSLLSGLFIVIFLYIRGLIYKPLKKISNFIIPLIVSIITVLLLFGSINILKNNIVALPNLFIKDTTDGNISTKENKIMENEIASSKETKTDTNNDFEKKKSNDEINSEENDNQQKDEKISLEREYSGDITNNRYFIWVNALKITENNRILGVSPRNLIPFAKVNYPYNYISVNGYETHNGYLAILVCTGVCGVITMLLFVGYHFLSTMHLYMRNKKINIDYSIILSIVIIIAVSAITLLDIFFMNTYTAAVFWIFLGYLRVLNNQKI